MLGEVTAHTPNGFKVVFQLEELHRDAWDIDRYLIELGFTPAPGMKPVEPQPVRQSVDHEVSEADRMKAQQQIDRERQERQAGMGVNEYVTLTSLSYTPTGRGRQHWDATGKLHGISYKAVLWQEQQELIQAAGYQLDWNALDPIVVNIEVLMGEGRKPMSAYDRNGREYRLVKSKDLKVGMFLCEEDKKGKWTEAKIIEATTKNDVTKIRVEAPSIMLEAREIHNWIWYVVRTGETLPSAQSVTEVTVMPELVTA